MQLVAFPLLSAVIQKRDPGIFFILGLFRVIGAHAAELEQKLRRTFGVGSGIKENTAAARRQNGRKSGAADPTDPFDHQRCRRQQRAAVSGGDKSVALAEGEHFEAEDHGRALMLPHDLRRIGVHIHDVVGVGDLHAGRQGVPAMLFHGIENFFSSAHEDDLHVIFLRRLQSAQNDLFRGVVAAHGVNDDLHLSSALPSVMDCNCARARFAIARFLLAFPLTRCSKGARIPKFTFIGWKFTMVSSLI